MKETKKEIIKEDKMKPHIKKQLIWIMWTTIIIIIGLILFKYIPMHLYGKNILFDASSHIIWTSWGLYVIWFFIDKKKSWRIPYFIFSAIVLTIMAIQRVIAGEHNEVGVMLGLAIAGIAIILPRWEEFRRGVDF